MNEVTEEQKKEIQNKILNWYKENKRDLPWRKTTNPYHILVSEVMLQQTQVDRVIPYYQKFLETFPTVEILAKAEPSTLLTIWSGLGFNGRVLRLQKTAEAVVKHHEGIFPTDEETLKTLPGIGPYTARAILSFAHNKEVPVIDTNIRRILIHEFHLQEDMPIKELEERAITLVPKGQSREWHNALMDYGATILTSKKTGITPLSKQSKFKGSDREVRGYIIKKLSEGETITKQELQDIFKEKDTEKIIKKMKEEQLIDEKGQNIIFPSKDL